MRIDEGYDYDRNDWDRELLRLCFLLLFLSSERAGELVRWHDMANPSWRSVLSRSLLADFLIHDWVALAIAWCSVVSIGGTNSSSSALVGLDAFTN